MHIIAMLGMTSLFQLGSPFSLLFYLSSLSLSVLPFFLLAHNDIYYSFRFEDDENRHNKPSIPVTKEIVDAVRARFKEIDARPIKKVSSTSQQQSTTTNHHF